MELLRNAALKSRAPDTSNVNTRCGGQNASIGSLETASIITSPAVNNACVASCPAAVAASAPVEVVTRVCTSTPKRAYAAVVTAHKPTVSQKKRQVGKTTGGKQSCTESINKGVAQQGSVRASCDKDGFIKVEKKKRKKPPCRNQCGNALSGPNMLLRPAIPSTQLYVSRLHHSTKVEEVVEYVRVKTNWTLRVVELESRHNTNFKSFVVRVPTHHVETFLKEEFWPKGVLFRRFRGRLRDTSQRNTTPSFRVQ